jgi:hypothetical protein
MEIIGVNCSEGTEEAGVATLTLSTGKKTAKEYAGSVERNLK